MQNKGQQSVDADANLDPELDEELDYYGEKNADTYHSFDHVAKVADWAAKLSWLFLVIAVLVGGINIAAYVESVGSSAFGTGILAVIEGIVRVLASMVSYLLYFVVLQAISAILLLLLDIEDNTRERAG